MTSVLEKIDGIRAMKAAGRKIAALTAYDYPMGRLLDESGIDVILVGDSLGMVVLGFPDTTSVTMEAMVHHTAAVCRGVTRALVVADLPIGSCTTVEDAVGNSRRLIEAGAGAVKIEGARPEEIRAIVGAGIPLMGHLGMLPQRVRVEGGYRVKGKTEGEAAELVEQARSVERAGAFSVVLELVQAEVAARISESLGIPTIGIGAGAGCDGQIPGDARFDRAVSVVSAAICEGGGGCGRGDSAGGGGVPGEDAGVGKEWWLLVGAAGEALDVFGMGQDEADDQVDGGGDEGGAQASGERRIGGGEDDESPDEKAERGGVEDRQNERPGPGLAPAHSHGAGKRPEEADHDGALQQGERVWRSAGPLEDPEVDRKDDEACDHHDNASDGDAAVEV